VTYFNAPRLNASLVAANGWDPAPLHRLAEHPLVTALEGRTADGSLTPQELLEVSSVLPESWFEEGAIVGTAADCAARLTDYVAAGVDEMIVHGSTPDLLGPLCAALPRPVA
jgi:alkanesulfonate monooxygenase SsuD/methylene tetrahydromethanopterin reductase-like flavin-dependent oxidoreductase (luciferase family)